jgi:hypothetical protein
VLNLWNSDCPQTCSLAIVDPVPGGFVPAFDFSVAVDIAGFAFECIVAVGMP